MSKRVEIKDAVVNLLHNTGKFYKVHKEPTDIEKERSFPVAWVYLGPETVLDGAISTTCYMREISLEVTIGVNHTNFDDDMDELIDFVFDFMKDEYTLSGASINLTPTDIRTDQGYFYPYALATLNFTVTTR